MRASEQEQTGGAGASEVSAKFQRIGWGPVPNDAHDLGTDLLVEARDHRLFDRGLIVGAQVKAGSSWFDHEVRDENGEIAGWWYYEPEATHFDDWVAHGLPHLLVLHDLDHNVSHWAHVTAEHVISTGKGCKIFVPREQSIDEEHLDELLAVAAQQKAAPELEGTSFTASADAVPPGRRLRYALLAPRLVAPHPNIGHEAPIAAEEALALCAQGRFLDLQRFADAHGSVPDPHQPYVGRDWRWSLVRAVCTWAFDDALDGLEHAAATAPTAEAKAAVGVVLACVLLRADRLTQACSVLDRLVEEDSLGPVDQGWVLVQRGRIRAEVGDLVGARADAVEAQRQFPGDADDVTVSGLASAAAWLLFRIAGFASGDLAGTLTAADNAIMWWRSQTIASALTNTVERAFHRWSQDTTSRWTVEDREEVNLFAAELNADLTAEHGAWSTIASLSSRQLLMRRHAVGDAEGISHNLHSLRRSGDHASLKLAVDHVRRVGPIESLVALLHGIGPESWTHTTAKSNLEVLARVGDLADESMAAQWIGMLLTVLRDPTDFRDRVVPFFWVDLAVVEAVRGLLPAGSPQSRLLAAECLASHEGPVDEVLASTLTDWIEEFSSEELTNEVRRGLRRLAEGDRGSLGAAVLGKLAEHDDAEAKQEVVARAIKGDLNALSAMGAVTILSSAQADSLIVKFEAMVRQTIESANRSKWGFGRHDAGLGLAVLNMWFPDVARWDPLLELLTHSCVAADHKRGALELIANEYERIPDEVLDRLAAATSAITNSPYFAEMGGRPLGAAAIAVAIASGAIADEAADIAVTQLSLGSEHERCDAAAIFGRGWCERMRPLLASFVADGRVSVRRAAANAVGRLSATDPDPLVMELARRLVHDRGAVVPRALLVGLSRQDADTALARETATALEDHPSAHVRGLARDFITRL
ncbi:DUF4365 domain-containing protein [Egibacter rhizosphaerae]|uniref:DUF4365 domain-containing protein n=1 Tax=Egibacter rhizosphaerae TaxID=1670831 RepID=UPI0013F1718C|nr:DUF4365 domain-containing protein [Egibacter rhizosphaerae]